MARPQARAPKPAPLERAARSETVKHYAETIFYIRQEEGRVRPGRLAEWLGVSAPTVTVTLQRLARDGFVEIGADRSVTLTPTGEDLAAKIVRVHRLLERWLTDVLGLDWATADEEAQRLASGVSERVADRLDETLGHPTTCPHGNVVPGREAPYGELVALSDLQPGVPARVRRISEVAEHDAPDLLRELDAYGLVTGARIVVSGADASVQAIPVDVGGVTRPIGTNVGRLIWVERETRARAPARSSAAAARPLTEPASRLIPHSSSYPPSPSRAHRAGNRREEDAMRIEVLHGGRARRDRRQRRPCSGRPGHRAPQRRVGLRNEYAPVLDPAHFVSVIDNPYFPLPVGRTLVYIGTKDGKSQTDRVTVTDRTKEILGITTTVVRDVARHHGDLLEKTFDFYAQDDEGTVWYLGEDTTAFEPNGHTDTSGSFEAGVDGAQPGIIMEGNPQIPDAYRQECYAGQAEDTAWVVATTGSSKVPYGKVQHVLTTLESTRIEPGAYDEKVYGPGIGIVSEHALTGDNEVAQLVSVSG